MKIGEIVKKQLVPLLLSGKVSKCEIENFEDKDYCKINFNLYVPMLKKYDGVAVYRYYSPRTTLLRIFDTDYLLTNDWYDDADRQQLQPLLNLLSKYE